MARFVVDSSVAPKWYVPEVDRTSALRLLTGAYELTAPKLLPIEMTNMLVQKVRRGTLRSEEAEEIAERLADLPIDFVENEPYLKAAYRLAHDFHPSAYDCLYAAVALALGVQVVTADRQFYDNLRIPHPEAMLWVTDIPS